MSDYDAVDASPYDLRGVVRRLRRHWRLGAAVVTAFVVLAGAWSSTLPVRYTGSAQFLIRTSGLEGPDTSDASIATQIAVMQSSAVAERVARVPRVDMTPEALLRSVSVRQSAGAVVEITAVASTGERAVLVARSFADQFVAYKKDVGVAAAQSRVTGLQQQVNDINARLLTLTRQRSALDGQTSAAASAQREQIDAQTASLNDQLSGLRGQVLAAQNDAASAANAGTLLEVSPVATAPSSPRSKRNLVLGVLVGLVAAIATVFVRDHFDDRIRSSEDAAAASGLPVLSVVPRGRRRMSRALRRADSHGGLPATASGDGAVPPGTGNPLRTSEAAKVLRATLVSRGVGQEHQVVLLTSDSAEGAGAPMAAQLAIAFAQSGFDTTYVRVETGAGHVGAQPPADPDRPLGRGLVSTSQPHLNVTTVGPPETGQVEDWLASSEAAVAVRRLRESFDVVVVDASAGRRTSLALSAALLADVSLVVVVAGQSRHSTVRNLVARLSNAGSTVLGTVLVGAASGDRTLGRLEPRRDDTASRLPTGSARLPLRRQGGESRSHVPLARELG